MTFDDLVDAVLAGLEQGEGVTIPSLPESGEWQQYDAARVAMGSNLSRSKPAARYNVASDRRAGRRTGGPAWRIRTRWCPSD